MAPLVTQWWRVCLPMQETQVRFLIQEDPKCHGAMKPMHHKYWAYALGHRSHNYWAHMPQLLNPDALEPMFHKREAATDRSLCTSTRQQPPLTRTREKPEQQRRLSTFSHFASAIVFATDWPWWGSGLANPIYGTLVYWTFSAEGSLRKQTRKSLWRSLSIAFSLEKS